MSEPFDAVRYISYLRSRWRWIASCAGIAVALAIVVSLLLPNQYTATARIVIDPPAGTDLRAAMAVSPIYLESLKTYEHFAGSDSLFQKAVDRFALHGSSIESLKRRVLRVQIVRNTRILEIAVTLPDPKKAQAMAAFLAEATVDLNRASVAESDQDLLRGMAEQERQAREHLADTERSWAQSMANEPTAGLQAAIEQSADTRARLEQQVQSVELEIADLGERLKQAGAEQSELRREDSNARARLAEMRKQLQDFDHQTAAREQLLAARQSHRDRAEAERKAAQTEFLAVETRLREARGESGYRGERLKIIDPGIVPERPSSPNLPLNVVGALLAGLVLPILYLTIEMSFQEQRAASRRSALRVG
ncbi:MAG TPA: Wzz/FepE/Etk N-terminal domain-containing protein [Verrucomicrobiae bacterium]|nr:Wzz/FepE/Etk N-terminal domain-containing protein [Verrucomicrobiae bacterium]